MKEKFILKINLQLKEMKMEEFANIFRFELLNFYQIKVNFLKILYY